MFYLRAIALITLTPLILLYPWLKCNTRSKQLFYRVFVKAVDIILPKERSQCIELGELFGELCYRIGLKKQLIKRNIAIVYGTSLNHAQQQALIRKINRFMVSVIFETLALRHSTQASVQASLVVENPDVIAQLKTDQEQSGVLILCGHIGNTEFLAQALSCLFENLFYYTSSQIEPLQDIIEQTRARFGAKHTSKTAHNTISVVRAFKNKSIVPLLSDLSSNQQTLFYPFFSELASVAPGAFHFATKLKLPVYFALLTRQPNHQYRISFKHFHCDYSQPPEVAQKQLIQHYFYELTQAVHTHPEQNYFWLTKRWSTRPQGDERRLYD